MAAPRSAAPINRGRLTELLAAMRGRKIAVLGDVMLDRYLLGDTERISPEAPVPVVTVTGRRLALGGAANVAANVVAIGSEAALVGVTGNDRDGEALRGEMTRAGLDPKWLLAVDDRPTTSKTRVMARGQQVVRIDEEDDATVEGKALTDLIELTERAIAWADVVLFEDYNKGVLAPGLIRAAMTAATARKLPTVVDPKFSSFFDYAGATLFKPNRRELSSAVPGIDLGSASDLQQAVERLGAAHLLLTLGAGGMVLVTRGERTPHLIESLARTVFDVSGAGDTVTAWAGTALAAGATAIEAAEIANLAASVEVTKPGVATVSPAEVLAAHAGR
jgi:D-beta-D-heptose 7-phosphate kinase/D-beta-D-heptose 1-phosphate adenosyltransferase